MFNNLRERLHRRATRSSPERSPTPLLVLIGSKLCQATYHVSSDHSAQLLRHIRRTWLKGFRFGGGPENRLEWSCNMYTAHGSNVFKLWSSTNATYEQRSARLNLNPRKGNWLCSVREKSGHHLFGLPTRPLSLQRPLSWWLGITGCVIYLLT